MRLAIAFAALCLTAPACAVAQDQPPPPAPIEIWSFEKMELMGRAIWRQDQAAIAASEVLHRQFPDSDPAGLVGWVVVDEGETQRVRFIVDDALGPRAGWDVVVRGRRAGTLTTPADAELSPLELTQYRARQTAAANVGAPVCGRLNSVVLRDPDSDDWLVWLLATASDSELSPFGGNYRFRISADGATVLRRDQLFRSCSMYPTDPRNTLTILYETSGVPPSEVIAYLSLENAFSIGIQNSESTLAMFRNGRIREIRHRMPEPRPLNGTSGRLGR
jgi:hypothetical protein